VVASGGIRGALDGAGALALGADAASLALPFLRAHEQGGERGVLELAERIGEGLRAVMLLTGARRPEALRRVPRRVGATLRSWVDGGPGASPASQAPGGPTGPDGPAEGVVGCGPGGNFFPRPCKPTSPGVGPPPPRAGGGGRL